MYHELAEDAMATQIEPLVFPFVVECHEVVVLVGLMYGGGYTADEIGTFGLDKSFGSIEKRHSIVDADTHVDIVLLCNIDYVLHIFERVPRREAKHQRYWDDIFAGFDDLYHLVVAVASPHIKVCRFVAVERYVEVSGAMSLDGIDDLIGSQAVGEQRVVWVVFVEPSEYGVGFGVAESKNDAAGRLCAG